MATNYQNVPNRDWQAPVQTAADLPTGSTEGEVRVVLDENAIYRWDATSQTWFVLISASNPGLNTLNGQTGSSQTFATSESGVNFTITSGSNIHTFNLPVASGTNTGKLSNTDWTTFNTKQVAGSYLTQLTGDIIAVGPGSANAQIAPDVIVNADVNSAAAIAYSKLNLVGSIVDNDVSNSAAISYSKLNLVDAIKNADINSAAAIVYSKLVLTDSIVNADINAAAAIVYSKLSLTNSIVNADVNASAGIAYTKLNLLNSITNADISNSAAILYSKLSLMDSIINSDINSAAAIAYSKLNLVASIVNNDISASAAIAYSKLALTGAIVNADVSPTAAIVYSKLSLLNSIMNADINASAGISYSKLDLASSIKNADVATNAAIAYTKLALTGTIVNSDISNSAAIAYSKLNLTDAIKNADISSVAAIAYSKLALTGTIVNADISNSAAIVYSKLVLTDSIKNSDISSVAAISGTKISPDFGSQNVTTTGTGTFNSVKAAATGGSGFVEIVNQSSAPATPTTAGRIYFDNSNRLSWKGTNGFVRTFDGTSNTADRIYTLEDEAGVIQLKPTTQSISTNTVLTSGKAGLICYVNTSAARSITLPVASLNSGRTITIKDVSGLGETNNITLIPNGTDRIEGLNANKVLSANFLSLTFISDATEWWQI